MLTKFIIEYIKQKVIDEYTNNNINMNGVYLRFIPLN